MVFVGFFVVFVAVLRHHIIFSPLYQRSHHSSWMKAVKPSPEAVRPLRSSGANIRTSVRKLGGANIRTSVRKLEFSRLDAGWYSIWGGEDV